MSRPDWQQRVIDEQHELQVKINKLEIFMGTDAYYALDSTDRLLLLLQYNSMTDYNAIVIERTKRFSA